MNQTSNACDGDDNGIMQKVKTSDGFEMPYTRVMGIAVPTFPGVVDVVREFRERFQVREDDIWILAYPNSGTHWLWEVTSMITRNKAERISEAKETGMLEYQSKINWSMNDVPSRRVLNTHLYPKHFNETSLKQNKFIFIVRNPKDVVVSRYHMQRGLVTAGYEGSFQGYFELFLDDKLSFEGWHTHLKDWWTVSQEMKDRWLFITYEDCIKDLPGNVRRIAEFLVEQKDAEFYEEVARLCGFQRMKDEKVAAMSEGTWKDPSQGFYRKGKVGGWKNWFTVNQSEALDAKLSRELTEPALQAMIHYEI